MIGQIMTLLWIIRGMESFHIKSCWCWQIQSSLSNYSPKTYFLMSHYFLLASCTSNPWVLNPQAHLHPLLKEKEVTFEVKLICLMSHT